MEGGSIIVKHRAFGYLYRLKGNGEGQYILVDVDNSFQKFIIDRKTLLSEYTIELREGYINETKRGRIYI